MNKWINKSIQSITHHLCAPAALSAPSSAKHSTWAQPEAGVRQDLPTPDLQSGVWLSPSQLLAPGSHCSPIFITLGRWHRSPMAPTHRAWARWWCWRWSCRCRPPGGTACRLQAWPGLGTRCRGARWPCACTAPRVTAAPCRTSRSTAERAQRALSLPAPTHGKNHCQSTACSHCGAEPSQQGHCGRQELSMWLLCCPWWFCTFRECCEQRNSPGTGTEPVVCLSWVHLLWLSLVDAWGIQADKNVIPPTSQKRQSWKMCSA